MGFARCNVATDEGQYTSEKVQVTQDSQAEAEVEAEVIIQQHRGR